MLSKIFKINLVLIVLAMTAICTKAISSAENTQNYQHGGWTIATGRTPNKAVPQTMRLVPLSSVDKQASPGGKHAGKPFVQGQALGNPRVPRHQNKGDIYWQKGNLVKAITQWQKEAKHYHEQNKISLFVEANLKISQAYIKLGQFGLAATKLEQIKTVPKLNSQTKALINRRLGNAYSGNGQYNKAIIFYKSSLKDEKSLYTLNNLVRTLQNLKQITLLKASELTKEENIQQSYTKAKDYESQALKYANQALILGQDEFSLPFVYSLIEWSRIEHNHLSSQQLVKAEKILTKLATSKSSVYLLINWASVDTERSLFWLAKAEEFSQKLKDPQLESYVFLELGYLYQRKGELGLALKYAKLAQEKAQPQIVSEILYRSQKLRGDLYQATGKRELAIDNYQNSIASADIFSQAISTTGSNRVIKFNLEIQSLYRESLKMILEQPKISPTNIKQALIISDKLRLSQLITYFGENCFEIDRQQLGTNNIDSNRKSKKIVTINSIVLPNKVFFFLQLPNGKIIKSQRSISELKLNELAKQWRGELITGDAWQFRERSKFFYDLIVRPFEAELESANPDILVFVNDGILRNLPMAALLDDNQFLIEKWAVSSSLGLKLKSPPKTQRSSSALVFGLSDPPKSKWRKLEGVLQEVRQIGNLIDAEEYLNSNFTVDNFSKKIKENDYSILHLATHGYFGGTAETSYLLAYDRKISVVELENILESSEHSPDLLVLSACDTALGSKLSLLGLAGVAAKSGINFTVGTLWQVQDSEQLEIINNFYANFNQDLPNEAMALQKVQIEQIRQFSHPQKWAALSLISN